MRYDLVPGEPPSGWKSHRGSMISRDVLAIAILVGRILFVFSLHIHINVFQLETEKIYNLGMVVRCLVRVQVPLPHVICVLGLREAHDL